MGIATLSKEMYSTLGKYPYWLFCTFSTSAFVVVVVVVVFVCFLTQKKASFGKDSSPRGQSLASDQPCQPGALYMAKSAQPYVLDLVINSFFQCYYEFSYFSDFLLGI